MAVITHELTSRAGAPSAYDAEHVELLLRHVGLRVTGAHGERCSSPYTTTRTPTPRR